MILPTAPAALLALAALRPGTALAQPVPDEPASPPGAEPLPPLVPPSLLHFEAVPYPTGIDEGRVEVALVLLVDEQGSVEELIEVDGPEPFASLAAWAGRRLRFQPALELGRPVAVELPFAYVFEQPPVNVRGQVRVHGTRAPGAALELAFGDRRTVTDAEGRFELRNVAPGEYLPRCADPAVRLDPLPVRIEPARELHLDLWAAVEWEDGELLGTWQRQRSRAVERDLSAREVATTPGTMGDPVRAVQNLPGLARSPLDSGWLLVRGGDPEDTGLYLDGLRVPLVYHVMGLTSVVHPAMVDHVEFQPGGADARYGRATGGIVDLRTRPVHGQGWETQAGVDLVSGGAFARVPLGRGGKVGLAGAVRRSYLDTLLTGAARRGWFGLEEGAEDIAPRFWDWQLRADHEHAGIAGLGYEDILVAPQADGGSVLLRVGTRRVHGRVSGRILGKRYELSPVLGFDWRRLSYPGYDDSRTQSVYGARAEFVDEGNGPLGFTAGVDWETGRYLAEVQTDEHPAGVQADRGVASVDPYADLRLGQERRLTLGLRIEDLWVYEQLVRAAPSPRAGGRVPLGEHLAAVATAGAYHQWPPLDLVVALPAGPYLELEQAWAASAGLEAIWPRLTLESTAYGRRIEHDTLVEDDGTVGQGRGVAWGVENLARARSGDLSGWISYTWSRSLRREEPGDPWEPHRFDQPHNVVAVLAWELPAGWVLASRLRAASGFPVEDDAVRAYDVLIQDQRCIADPDITGELGACPAPGERLPATFTLDLKVLRTFTFRAWSLEAYLDVQNVANRRTAEPVITGSLDLGTLYAFGFPILPIFGAKGTWRR